MKKYGELPAGVLYELPCPEGAAPRLTLDAGLQGRKLVVLDDDPTGVQTVHDVYVYTDWSEDTFIEALRDESGMFFVLTNSRGLSAAESERLHREIARNLAAASRRAKVDFSLISRSNSTLRGHYPLETQTLREKLEKELGIRFDGEVICPFFPEGGRYTLNNVHYVLEGDRLVPAGETEFARDKTFGYKASALPEWCEEKTRGEYRAEDVLCVSIEELRSGDVSGVADRLAAVRGFGKVAVNAADYEDLRAFAAALREAESRGSRFMFRSAAALPKVLGGISDRALLTREELLRPGDANGGLIVAGSHVMRTTRQLQRLRESRGELRYIEFDQHTVMRENGLEAEAARVSAEASACLREGATAVVYTRRDRLDLKGGAPEEQLEVSVRISEAVTDVVSLLDARPSFIIAKGGITSSSIGTDALGVKKALVLGQVLPGVPVWRTGEESRFPGMPYIIFPGNVGGDDSLLRIVERLV